MNTPPGLTCCRCHLPFRGSLARRTLHGWAHATACASPTVLSEGRWVTGSGGVKRWEAA